MGITTHMPGHAKRQRVLEDGARDSEGEEDDTMPHDEEVSALNARIVAGKSDLARMEEARDDLARRRSAWIEGPATGPVTIDESLGGVNHYEPSPNKMRAVLPPTVQSLD